MESAIHLPVDCMTDEMTNACMTNLFLFFFFFFFLGGGGGGASGGLLHNRPF